MSLVIPRVDAWHEESANMVHWCGLMPCDRRSLQLLQSLQNVHNLNGMCVGVVFGACHESAAGQEGWKCLLLVRSTRGSRGSGPCVLHMRFARAPELADACVSVHPVVALWRWGLRAAERDVSHKNSGVLSTQITILGVLEPPNT
jgi:hypothetical protein